MRNQAKSLFDEPLILGKLVLLVLVLVLLVLVLRIDLRFQMLPFELQFHLFHVFFFSKHAKLWRWRAFFDFLETLQRSSLFRQDCLNLGEVLEKQVASNVADFAVSSRTDCLLEGFFVVLHAHFELFFHLLLGEHLLFVVEEEVHELFGQGHIRPLKVREPIKNAGSQDALGPCLN